MTNGKKKLVFVLIFSFFLILSFYLLVSKAVCSGCEFQGKCYEAGDELVVNSVKSYCSLEKKFLAQKLDSESCDNDFECLNDLCSYGKCVNLYKEVKEKGEKIKEIGEKVKRADASITLSTIKDIYSVGEKVELTDPPEDSADVSSANFLSEPSDLQEIKIREIKTEKGEFFEIKREGKKAVEFSGYIVQFEENPVLVRKIELEKKIGELEEKIEEATPVIGFVPNIVRKIQISSAEKSLSELDDYREELEEKHEEIILKAEKAGVITGKVVDEREEGKEKLEIEEEFTDVFNGVSLDISASEAEEIKKIKGVKEVYPNLIVNITLMDSVPLVGADKVWQMKDSQNREVTGKDVKIAIIDTGVDYTHADLGGSGWEKYERDFQVINSLPIKPIMPYYLDQLISIDNNRLLAIFNCRSFELYQFNGNTISFMTPQLPQEYCLDNAIIKDNYIAYSANRISSGDFQWRVYLYDINTGENLLIRQVDGGGALNGPLALSKDYLAYSWSGRDSNTNAFLYLYDIKNRNEQLIEGNKWLGAPFLENNKLIYYFISGAYSHYLYDIPTKTKSLLSIPGGAQILDFKSNRVIYRLARATPYTYRVYDMASNKIIATFYGDGSVQSSYIGQDTIMKAYLEQDKFYFGTYNGARRYVYDFNSGKTGLINNYIPAGDFDTENNKICFVSSNYLIYCHDYNSNYDYSAINIPFNNKVVGGYDFANNDNDPKDDNGHGTHVAGIAAGSGALKGVAPGAKIYAYKVLSSGGWGYDDWVIAGIEKAVKDKVDIISMSLGGDCWQYNKDCGPDDPVSQAVDNAVGAGVVVVVSAGNSGPKEKTIGSPGTARKAITVGATYKKNYDGNYFNDLNPKTDQITSFSSRGPVVWKDATGKEQSLIKPDVVAPGALICSAQYDEVWNSFKCFDDKHILLAGTSMAAPHVAGAVALIKQAHPDWKPEEIKSALKNTAVSVGKEINTQGYGRVDALAAVKLIEPPEMPWDLYIYSENYINNIYNKIIIKGIFPENYDSLIVEYSKENENNWKRDGITTIGKNGIIAEFNPKGKIKKSGDYEFRATIIKKGLTKTFETKIYFDEDLKQGWPISLGRVNFGSSPQIVDIDSDGKKEIIIASGEWERYLYVFDEEGNNKPGWPIDLTSYDSDAKSGATPILIDLNKDSTLEIILLVYFQNNYFLYAWDSRGRLVKGWPIKLNENLNFKDVSMKSLASDDLDGDGEKEIVIAIDYYIFVFTLNGIIKQGWPQKMNCAAFADVAIANLDNGEKKQVIYSCSYPTQNTYVYIYNSDGSLKKGWPKQYPLAGSEQVVVGDIDKDRNKEIIFKYRDLSTEEEYDSLVDVVDPKNGKSKPGWPKNGGIFQHISLADINKDNSPEIVVSSSKYLRVFKYDGSYLKGWPVSFDSVSYTIIGDFGGDSYPDIIVGYPWYGVDQSGIYAFDRTGHVINGWPKSIEGALMYSSPALDDIDNDGDADLIVAAYPFSFNNPKKVYVFDLKTPYNYNSIEWPMFMHDTQHTGCYDCKPKIKSQVLNFESKDREANLVMKVQKKEGKEWRDVKVIVDKKVKVPTKKNLALDKVWADEGGWKATEKGEHRVYAALTSSQGSVLLDLNNKPLEASYEFKVA